MLLLAHFCGTKFRVSTDCNECMSLSTNLGVTLIVTYAIRSAACPLWCDCYQLPHIHCHTDVFCDIRVTITFSLIQDGDIINPLYNYHR
jgi:hypothetical protein